MTNLLAVVSNDHKKQFAPGNNKYYNDDNIDCDVVLNGLPPPNTYTENNHLLSASRQKVNKPPPPPKPNMPIPSHPTPLKSNKKELGTSDEYINKQLEKVIEGLNIPQHARPAMLALSKPQKLLMIQQYSRKQQNGNEIPNVTNVKRQNQPKVSNTNLLNLNLVPIMAKNISAPILTSGLSPNGTISLSEAQKKQKANALKRSQTSNGLSVKKRSSEIITKQKSTPSKIRHKKSKSNMSRSYQAEKQQPPPVPPMGALLILPNPIKVAKSDSCLPPPVPQSIKQKYSYKSGTQSNRSSSVKSFHSDTSAGTADEKQGFEMEEKLDEDDGEYEYYDEEYEEYEEKLPPEPQKPDSPKPPTPRVVKKKRVKNVKVKLRIGSAIEVYSNSRKKWIDGKIIKIKGKLICVAYGAGSGTQKWLEAKSRNFRPKLANVKKVSMSNVKLPMLNPSVTSEADLDSEFDAKNNPTPSRFRKSIAFKEKKQVKVKLRIGSPVEVYSVSKDKWIDGELRTIKKDLIKVAYGKGLTTEKWLRANSKQFRPKLDMVDAAVKHHRNSIVPHKNGHKMKVAASKKAMARTYSIDDEESVVGTHIPQPPVPMFEPVIGMNNMQNKPPPPVLITEEDIGAYVTHSLRREQYQQFSVGAVQGTNKKRGELKIKIHGALQLRNNGSFAMITIAEHSLKTQKVSSDENPVWKEILTFSNYRPHIGKNGIISIGHKSMLGEKIIGSAEFELPIVFNRQEKMTIDIADSKNKLSGIVVLEQCVVELGK